MPAPVPPVSTRKLPWLLLPKLLLVAVLLGSFVSTLVLVLAMPREDLKDWQEMLDAVGTLFRWLIVPGSFALVLVSLGLLWPRRRLLRQRWMQVKVVLLVITLPALHLLARWTFTAMRREVADGSPEGPTGRLGFFTDLVVVTIVVLVTAVWLARFRPALGRGREAE